jgi:hypothetical protein
VSRDALLAVPGVVGVGLGLKETAGRVTDVVAWRVYVDRKRSLSELHGAQVVPPRAGGLPTDVIEKAPSVPSSVVEGVRLANAHGVPGTLGCFALTRETRTPVALTNHHVLFGRAAAEGDAVWLVRDGLPSDDLPQLGRTRRGHLGTVVHDGQDVFVDGAVATLADGKLPRRRRALGIAMTRPGARVTKAGAATGVTAGVVLDVEYPDVARLPDHVLPAPRQLLVGPAGGERFSADGDSGAAVIDEAGHVVGLLWGLNHRGESVASPAAAVAAALDIDIAPPRPRLDGLFSRRR